MPLTQRQTDIMQVESEFSIQEELAKWQRSFLAGRTTTLEPILPEQDTQPLPEEPISPNPPQTAPVLKEQPGLEAPLIKEEALA
jgi:hypothetical protein